MVERLWSNDGEVIGAFQAFRVISDGDEGR